MNNLLIKSMGFESLDLVTEDFIRHTSLNMIRSIRSKNYRTYGELVLAFDSRGSWRKESYPFYKDNRKKDRDNSNVDWGKIFAYMGKIKSELIETFPYAVVEVEKCEGDDVIAVLSQWCIENRKCQNDMFDRPESVLIVSSDGDFHQLHSEYIKQEPKSTRDVSLSKERILFEHIVKGDAGDGVPNVLSPDNVFIDKIRQKPVTKVKLDLWFENTPDDPIWKERFERNKALIDLSCVPDQYKQKIIDTYLNYKLNDRSKLMNYFMKNELIELIDSIQDF